MKQAWLNRFLIAAAVLWAIQGLVDAPTRSYLESKYRFNCNPSAEKFVRLKYSPQVRDLPNSFELPGVVTKEDLEKSLTIVNGPGFGEIKELRCLGYTASVLGRSRFYRAIFRIEFAGGQIVKAQTVFDPDSLDLPKPKLLNFASVNATDENPFSFSLLSWPFLLIGLAFAVSSVYASILIIRERKPKWWLWLIGSQFGLFSLAVNSATTSMTFHLFNLSSPILRTFPIDGANGMLVQITLPIIAWVYLAERNGAGRPSASSF